MVLIVLISILEQRQRQRQRQRQQQQQQQTRRKGTNQQTLTFESVRRLGAHCSVEREGRTV